MTQRSSSDQATLVIGAGVIGLTTAVVLAEAGRDVRIWAAEPPERTTSMVAGALWGPSFQQPLAETAAWTRSSLPAFSRLAATPGTGVRMAPALTVGDFPPGDAPPPGSELIPDLRPCPPGELPDGFTMGFRSTMPLVDMPTYLDHLTRRFTTAGGELEIRTARSIAEATDVAPVVVNCSGLGARALAGDVSVQPVRGQHVVLTNPGLDELFMELGAAPEWTSYFPHPGRVVCGGISTPGSWDTEPDPAFTERVLRRCTRIEPRLADAEVIETVVGLRPGRPSVRVELETLGSARCVHNYGHGGSGVSLSWGCANRVLDLLAPASR